MDELPFRIEKLTDDRFYTVFDNGDHARDVLQCTSRLSTVEELALWDALKAATEQVVALTNQANAQTTERPFDKRKAAKS